MWSERKESEVTPRFITEQLDGSMSCHLSQGSRHRTCLSLSHPASPEEAIQGRWGGCTLVLGPDYFQLSSSPTPGIRAQPHGPRWSPSHHIHIPNSGMRKEGKGDKWASYILKTFSRSCHTTRLHKPIVRKLTPFHIYLQGCQEI